MTSIQVDTTSTAAVDTRAEEFIVSWRNPHTRRYSWIGSLLHSDHEFAFHYVEHAVAGAGFAPILDFVQTQRRYRSRSIFPFFSDRVPSLRRIDRPEWLRYIGAPQTADIFEILHYSFGRNGTDHYEFFPASAQGVDSWNVQMPLHGVRYHPVTEQLIESGHLDVGTELHVVSEPENEFDERALSVTDKSGNRLGYLSSAFLDYLEAHRELAAPQSVHVLRLNERPAGAHLRVILEVGGALTAQN